MDGEKAPRALFPAVRLRLTCMCGTVCIAPGRAWTHNVDVCSTATGGKLEDGDAVNSRQVRRQRTCASASCVRASAGTVRRRSFEFSQRVMIDGRHVEETGRKGIDASMAQRGLLCAFSPGQNEEPEAKRSLGPSCYEERVERETGCSECRSSRAGFQKAGWPV
jgi:hypothetical protein